MEVTICKQILVQVIGLHNLPGACSPMIQVVWSKVNIRKFRVLLTKNKIPGFGDLGLLTLSLQNIFRLNNVWIHDYKSEKHAHKLNISLLNCYKYEQNIYVVTLLNDENRIRETEDEKEVKIQNLRGVQQIFDLQQNFRLEFSDAPMAKVCLHFDYFIF